ncbi:mitochondrial ribosomal death-associated protein 3-domain-containing protein [Fomitopsis serialis]|uniref:mitochondrial ribosomal death-associated protein 3-domain-containing protein n=1 Tax=Fomitopsis serialis TaxID=139415 RepID=UPI002008188C|nr:mitochondrial ribosomal death-associated protein 3-domain-containing protein [Neoantrodia serialis]KAH9933487.1 mitochondrial ribosomal death-associated protein 3-domain-containing protein [Neoantrodia serialis]
MPLSVNQLTKSIFQSDQRLELQLPTFSPEAMNYSVGKALAFPASQNEAMRAFGVPDSALRDFRILSRPCSVVRDVTISALNVLDGASDKSSRDTRLIMTGPTGCGKSYLLLQTVEYAAHSDWIVMYIPRGLHLVDSSKDYAYDARTRTYSQPAYSDQLLRRFLSVNERLIETLKTREHVSLEDAPVPAGSPLSELVKAGVQNPVNAPVVLAVLMDELSHQSTYPVLLAVDDMQAMYGYSLYRDAHYRQIMAQHLAIPRMILEYASGKKAFPRGAVMGAAGTQHTAFKMPLELCEALGLPPPRPAGPYTKRSPETTEFARGLKNFPVSPRMSVSEAASLFEVWMQDKALHTGEVRVNDELRSVPNDELFMSKYAEADGNPRAFVQNGLLATQMTL